jgi:hypothetical protein
MAKIVLVRKRGARKDGWNYHATCTICFGSKQDINGVGGVTKEEAERLALKHCKEVHLKKENKL